MGNLTGLRLLIQALHIALDEFVKRTAHKHLDEANLIGLDRTFNIVARPLVWRDGSAEYCYPVARQQSRDETDASDICFTILFREAQPAAQVLAHFVAVKSLNPMPQSLEFSGE